jgi:hypothetical protein
MNRMPPRPRLDTLDDPAALDDAPAVAVKDEAPVPDLSAEEDCEETTRIEGPDPKLLAKLRPPIPREEPEE